MLLLFSHLVMSDTFVTPWTVAHQAPLSMGFSRQEYWSGLPFPPPGDLPNPGMEPESPAFPALAYKFFSTVSPVAAAAAKSLQSCPTLCDSIDGSPRGSSVLGFPRQEYWSGVPFPSPMHACMLSRFSCVQLCVTPWTAAHQVPLSMGFSRQEYWSGVIPSPQYISIHCQLFPVRERLLCS